VLPGNLRVESFALRPLIARESAAAKTGATDIEMREIERNSRVG